MRGRLLAARAVLEALDQGKKKDPEFDSRCVVARWAYQPPSSSFCGPGFQHCSYGVRIVKSLSCEPKGGGQTGKSCVARVISLAGCLYGPMRSLISSHLIGDGLTATLGESVETWLVIFALQHTE